MRPPNPQLRIPFPIEPPYDPRVHPYVVTAIERKDGTGFEPDNSGIIIYMRRDPDAC